MSKESLIKKYNAEIQNINSQISSFNSTIPTVQSKINELTSPIAQFDNIIAQLTVNVNQVIQQISLVSIAATNCGCGIVTSYIETNPSSPSFGTTVTVSVGSTYFYEHAKASRINAEDTTYTDIYPFNPLSSTSGYTDFNSGIGSNTTVLGSSSNAILSIVVTNGGSGYASSLSPYYNLSLVGGSGTGAKVDVIVSAAGTVSQVNISSGGSGYSVTDTVTLSQFPSATFKIVSVGSPILGVGTLTYIDASSTIGSTFVPTINASGISSCPTSCSSYSSQVTQLISSLNSLRSQRQTLINAVNTLKGETTKLFTQRYSFVYSNGQLNQRLNTINSVLGVVNGSGYDQYFG